MLTEAAPILGNWGYVAHANISGLPKSNDFKDPFKATDAGTCTFWFKHDNRESGQRHFGLGLQS